MAEKDPLLREVDEAVRQQRYQSLWDKYRNTVIASIVALVMVTGGVSVYRELANQHAANFTQSFVDAQRLMDKAEFEKADQAFAALAAEESGARKAVALLWRADAQRADNRPEAANAGLRNFVEQETEATLWRDIACLQLLSTELIPEACNGASESPLGVILGMQNAATYAQDAHWEHAAALLQLAANDPSTPAPLAADALMWQEVIKTQAAKAAVGTLAEESN